MKSRSLIVDNVLKVVVTAVAEEALEEVNKQSLNLLESHYFMLLNVECIFIITGYRGRDEETFTHGL